MRYCPYCKIEVGGDLHKCPVCQSKLFGEPEEPYFPRIDKLQIKSFFYKLQLFIAWILIIAALGIDFLFGVRISPFRAVHWSLLIAMWLIVLEFWMLRQFSRGTGSARNMTYMTFVILLMLWITSHYTGFEWLVSDWIAPIALMATMVANFVFVMTDKNGNDKVYLLINIVVGALPYLVLHIRDEGTPITWILCLLISIILFIGAIIFKGRTVAAEFRRRLSL